jgi:uncharacterized membrane protein YoaK (UPF0700 family)
VPPISICLLLLSLAAGCVDAIAFVGAGVFPANMTGNSVVLALALPHGGGALPALALASFCLGAAAGWRLVAAEHPGWTARVNVALLLAALLVLASAGVLAVSAGKFLPWLLGATAMAMGLQSAAVQQIGVPGVATVFVTGTLTTGIARLVTTIRRRAGAALTPPAAPWLPLLTWAAYFSGAVLGGLHHLVPGGIAFAFPGLLLLTAIVLSERARRSVS